MSKITKLSNGIKVISQNISSHFCSAGVFVDAGSRFENNQTLGASHILDKLTLKSTEKYSSGALVEKIENMGGQFQCVASKELIMYQGMIFHKDVDPMFDVLGQIVRKPLILENELDDAKLAASYDVYDSQWDPNATLPDKLHAIAFRDPTLNVKDVIHKLDSTQSLSLGRSTKVDLSRLDSINVSTIRQFRDTLFTPDRIAIAGVGIDHDHLVELAEREFGDMKPASASIIQAQKDVSLKAIYTGGTAILDTTNLPSSPNPDDMTLTHLQIAFEAMGMQDPDIYALSTLASLLGGGGSFSAGGPGKGMYTRLYTQVLNRHGWIENCNVLNHVYKDSSLFGITIAVCSDEATHHHVANVLCDQIISCTSQCTRTELDRAKNQLKSNLLMALESQLVQLEDMGRQALIYGKRMDVMEMCRRIDMVTQSDIIRVGRRVFLGETTPSSFDFNDEFCKPWQPSGPWKPTILVEGPLVGKNDALWGVEKTLSKWGLVENGPSHLGRKRKFFNFLNKN